MSVHVQHKEILYIMLGTTHVQKVLMCWWSKKGKPQTGNCEVSSLYVQMVGQAWPQTCKHVLSCCFNSGTQDLHQTCACSYVHESIDRVVELWF